MLTQGIFERWCEAYISMATAAKYRPAAPGDGLGHVSLTEEELSDPGRLQKEARDYARQFYTEECTGNFHIGRSNFTTNCALVYAIEAARLVCGGGGGGGFVMRLFEMALVWLRVGR